MKIMPYGHDARQTLSTWLSKLPKGYGTEKLTDQIKKLELLGSLNQFKQIVRKKDKKYDRKSKTQEFSTWILDYAKLYILSLFWAAAVVMRTKSDVWE